MAPCPFARRALALAFALAALGCGPTAPPLPPPYELTSRSPADIVAGPPSAVMVYGPEGRLTSAAALPDACTALGSLAEQVELYYGAETLELAVMHGVPDAAVGVVGDKLGPPRPAGPGATERALAEPTDASVFALPGRAFLCARGAARDRVRARLARSAEPPPRAPVAAGEWSRTFLRFPPPRALDFRDDPLLKKVAAGAGVTTSYGTEGLEWQVGTLRSRIPFRVYMASLTDPTLPKRAQLTTTTLYHYASEATAARAAEALERDMARLGATTARVERDGRDVVVAILPGD